MTDQQEEQWYSVEERKLIHKERYFTTSHNYFFEVKEAKNGSKYIIVDQRKKVGDKYVSAKIRIFEDELLEFERIFHNLIQIALKSGTPENNLINPHSESSQNIPAESDLVPAFFQKLSVTNNWQEFEEYTYYVLKLLGIQTIYNFLGERQAGRADGFFKLGNLAVIYDCTLDKKDVENNKSDQITNYCNRLQQGSMAISNMTTEEFHHHHKQVWIITQGNTRSIKIINGIEVKEICINDLMNLYRERLKSSMNEQLLEMSLRNL